MNESDTIVKFKSKIEKHVELLERWIFFCNKSMQTNQHTKMKSEEKNTKTFKNPSQIKRTDEKGNSLFQVELKSDHCSMEDSYSFILNEVRSGSVPKPFSKLLEHKNSMTKTLETFFKNKMTLNVLESEFVEEQNLIRRYIILVADKKPHINSEDSDLNMKGLFAAINIYLDPLPTKVGVLLKEGKIPFGTVLGKNNIEQIHSPLFIFETKLNDIICNTFVQNQKKDCAKQYKNINKVFGRFNSIRTSTGEVIADVVEILNPFSSYYKEDGNT